MLSFDTAQLTALTQASVKNFENEMVLHSRQFSPRLSEVIGDDQLRLAIQAAMARAANHGFSNRGPVRLFIEMMFLFGSAFDDDPQYPWAAAILAGSAPQMERADQLYEKLLDYQAQVSGPQLANTREALKMLAQLPARLPEFTPAEFVQGVISELRHVFPEKAAYLGEQALRALIQEAGAVAQQAGFATSRSYALVAALMFAFGHACHRDLLYPWIARTLADPRIDDPVARADRLERKALTWLSHVLAQPTAGAAA